ncbi:DUF4411 family protein [Brevibacterium ravenspurgense]|nr:DUF4411 family protein [Brevibacterium ravenspurgense]MCG7301294.1 DUF4411 family protein [Brevibacterium ravenspurgense]
MYLLDANVLIEAKNRYYAFDIAPGFWDWLHQAHLQSLACSIEAVRSVTCPTPVHRCSGRLRSATALAKPPVIGDLAMIAPMTIAIKTISIASPSVTTH